MGGKQEGALWDDSALINAFDDAMSNYKKMHNKKTNEGGSTSTKEETTAITTVEQQQQQVITQEEAKRQEDADDHSIDALKTTVEIGETSNISEVKENHVDSHVPVSDSQVSQDMKCDYTYSWDVGDYNQLLNQYYEVEEERQKLLEQLYQFGGWNYQNSGEGSGSVVQGDTAYTSQQHAVPTCQPSNPSVVCSCCPYICQCVMPPCSSFPASFLAGSCVGQTCTDACSATSPGKSFSLEDGRIVNTAMGTAERALSSMKRRVSGDSNITEENTDKKDEKHEGEMAQSTSSDTDLSVVLNAWYSAGFYTGKYLVEQSIAKKRHS